MSGITFDRLLARLVAVAADAWVLKGGFALDLRLAERPRVTKDVDLDWHEPDDELLDTLLDAADHDAGDFFTGRYCVRKVSGCRRLVVFRWG